MYLKESMVVRHFKKYTIKTTIPFAVYNTELDSVGMVNIKWLGANVCKMFINMTKTLSSELKTGPGILLRKVIMGK